MKVILISKVKNLGNISDVKIVADGYAKNHLVPKKLALPYSEEIFKNFEQTRLEIQKQNDLDFAKANELKEKIEKLDIIIIENAGDNDKLYGSISSIRLAHIINDLLKTKELEKSRIIIKTPIKELGIFNITLELHHDVVFEKSITIARSLEEADKRKKGELTKVN